MIKARNVVAEGELALMEYYAMANVKYDDNDKIDCNDVIEIVRRKVIVDVEQWDLEDRIRIETVKGDDVKVMKRRIDELNMMRTRMTEQIDSIIRNELSDVKICREARKASESPGMAIDRLCIILVRRHKMEQRRAMMSERSERYEELTRNLAIVEQQIEYLADAIDCLMEEMERGVTQCCWVRQMKMYAND